MCIRDRPQPEKCECHSLTVKDGECSNSSVIGKYCGKLEKPLILSSAGRYLRLEYQSEKLAYEDDFTAIYAAGSASRQSERTVRNFHILRWRTLLQTLYECFRTFRSRSLSVNDIFFVMTIDFTIRYNTLQYYLLTLMTIHYITYR